MAPLLVKHDVSNAKELLINRARRTRLRCCLMIKGCVAELTVLWSFPGALSSLLLKDLFHTRSTGWNTTQQAQIYYIFAPIRGVFWLGCCMSELAPIFSLLSWDALSTLTKWYLDFLAWHVLYSFVWALEGKELILFPSLQQPPSESKAQHRHRHQHQCSNLHAGAEQEDISWISAFWDHNHGYDHDSSNYARFMHRVVDFTILGYALRQECSEDIRLENFLSLKVKESASHGGPRFDQWQISLEARLHIFILAGQVWGLKWFAPVSSAIAHASQSHDRFWDESLLVSSSAAALRPMDSPCTADELLPSMRRYGTQMRYCASAKRWAKVLVQFQLDMTRELPAWRHPVGRFPGWRQLNPGGAHSSSCE